MFPSHSESFFLFGPRRANEKCEAVTDEKAQIVDPLKTEGYGGSNISLMDGAGSESTGYKSFRSNSGHASYWLLATGDNDLSAVISAATMLRTNVAKSLCLRQGSSSLLLCTLLNTLFNLICCRSLAVFWSIMDHFLVH